MLAELLVGDFFVLYTTFKFRLLSMEDIPYVL